MARPHEPTITIKAAVTLLGVVLAGGAAGCSRVEVDDISAEFVRHSSATCEDAGGRSSGGGPQQSGRPMDTYVIRLLEFDDPSMVAPDAKDCITCAAGQNCHVEPPTCLCGAPVQPSVAELGTMLSGVRLGTLDYERVYCLQVLALDRSALPPGDGSDDPAGMATGAGATHCECDDSWTAPAALATDARLCALSVPYTVGPLSLRMEVECRGDGAPFNDCLGI
jgi:hypothetical protein